MSGIMGVRTWWPWALAGAGLVAYFAVASGAWASCRLRVGPAAMAVMGAVSSAVAALATPGPGGSKTRGCAHAGTSHRRAAAITAAMPPSRAMYLARIVGLLARDLPGPGRSGPRP